MCSAGCMHKWLPASLTPITHRQEENQTGDLSKGLFTVGQQQKIYLHNWSHYANNFCSLTPFTEILKGKSYSTEITRIHNNSPKMSETV